MDLDDLYHQRGMSLLLAQHAAAERARVERQATAGACAYATEMKDVLRLAWQVKP